MIQKPVTLITGTRKGLGKHLAHHYCALGHQVLGISRKKPTWILDGYRHFSADITNEDQIVSCFSKIRSDYGRLDHLINNAAMAKMNHSLFTPVESVNEVLQTNVSGTFLLCRESARMMHKQKFGRIVNFSSTALPLKLEGEAIYAASKAAVEALTQILSREFIGMGITVNCIGPSLMKTDLTKNVPEKILTEIIDRQVIKKIGTPEDVANVVDFFLSEKSHFVTGQCVYLGGL